MINVGYNGDVSDVFHKVPQKYILIAVKHLQLAFILAIFAPSEIGYNFFEKKPSFQKTFALLNCFLNSLNV
jgi:hypothetical protein